ARRTDPSAGQGKHPGEVTGRRAELPCSGPGRAGKDRRLCQESPPPHLCRLHSIPEAAVASRQRAAWDPRAVSASRSASPGWGSHVEREVEVVPKVKPCQESTRSASGKSLPYD